MLQAAGGKVRESSHKVMTRLGQIPSTWEIACEGFLPGKRRGPFNREIIFVEGKLGGKLKMVAVMKQTFELQMPSYASRNSNEFVNDINCFYELLYIL